MVITSGLRARAWSMASLPLVAVPTTWIVGSEERISETRRRKKPESSTTRTLTAINTPKSARHPEGRRALNHVAWVTLAMRDRPVGPVFALKTGPGLFLGPALAGKAS